jgi:hypothetical protein
VNAVRPARSSDFDSQAGTGQAWARVRAVAPEIAAAVFGLGWALALGIGPALRLTNDRWLEVGDSAKAHLGWVFFRHARLGLPLGALPDLLHPLGTNIGFTDSIPWLALLLRPLAPILPEHFQYLGPWVALCFALQGVLGARLAALATMRPLERALGGALFSVTPILPMRVGHEALCAQWLLLAALLAALRPCPDRASARRTALISVALCPLAAGIHPYLLVMVLVLTLAALSRRILLERRLSPALVLATPLAAVTLSAGVLYLFGLLRSGIPSGAVGFGRYAANLSTLINPADTSRLRTGWPITFDELEGYGYLGAGVLGLLLASPLALLWRRTRPSGRTLLGAAPVALAALAMALFALSQNVRWGQRLVHDASRFYQPLLKYAEALRSSGRFIWPLHHLLVAAAVLAALRLGRLHRLLGSGLLAAALLVQLYELRIGFPRDHFRQVPERTLDAKLWEQARGDYRHVVLFPPLMFDAGERGCVEVPYPPDYYVPFARLAARLSATVNSGYVARLDEARAHAYCHQLAAEVGRGQLAPATLYVVHPDRAQLFGRTDLDFDPHAAGGGAADAVCGRLDGLLVCVSPGQHDAFRALLESHPG